MASPWSNHFSLASQQHIQCNNSLRHWTVTCMRCLAYSWMALYHRSEAHYSTFMMDFHAFKKDSLFMEDYLREAKKISNKLTTINRSVSLTDLHIKSFSALVQNTNTLFLHLTMGITASFEELHGIYPSSIWCWTKTLNFWNSFNYGWDSTNCKLCTERWLIIRSTTPS